VQSLEKDTIIVLHTRGSCLALSMSPACVGVVLQNRTLLHTRDLRKPCGCCAKASGCFGKLAKGRHKEGVHRCRTADLPERTDDGTTKYTVKGQRLHILAFSSSGAPASSIFSPIVNRPRMVKPIKFALSVTPVNHLRENLVYVGTILRCKLKT